MNPKANEPKANQIKRKQSQPYFPETSNEIIDNTAAGSLPLGLQALFPM